jgi:hypothetical protein
MQSMNGTRRSDLSHLRRQTPVSTPKVEAISCSILHRQKNRIKTGIPLTDT